MGIVEWNKKEELILDQALRHIKVLYPLSYPCDSCLVFLLNEIARTLKCTWLIIAQINTQNKYAQRPFLLRAFFYRTEIWRLFSEAMSCP